MPVGLLDFLQLDNEVQRGVWRNRGRPPRGAVTQLAGDFQLNHSPFADQLHSFGPAGDNFLERERGGFSSIVGTVELLAAVEPAPIMQDDSIVIARLAAFGLSENPVIESRAGRSEFLGRVVIDLTC